MSDRIPAHEEIQARAYHLWQQRGCPWGTPDTDWFEAERELSKRGPESGLLELAREVGSVVGTVVAAVRDKLA